MLLPVGGEDTLAFMSCGACLASWEINYVPIDHPPWSVVNRNGNDRLQVPRVREGSGLAYPRAKLAAAW